MFALQGEAITSDPGKVIRVAIPLLLYFVLMWSIAFFVGRRSGLDYERTSALAFTAAGNNFELAIAVAISIWGVASQQALAGVIGPLIEVPVLVTLVYLSLWLKSRLFTPRQGVARSGR
jgi:ACR3 family arsenite transporter